MNARAAIAALCTLLAAHAAAQAQPTPSPFRTILERERDAPVTITKVAGYQWTEHRGTAILMQMHRYCISFVAATRPVSSVTFEISHRRLDGSVTAVATLKRDGTFAPGTEIVSYQGEAVAGPGDQHALAGCVDFPPAFVDAPLTVLRPIAATYADGTVWAALRAPVVAETPIAVPDDRPPPWDADHHAGYVAAITGGGATMRGPKTVLVFAPRHRLPSASLAFASCCVEALAFDLRGNLVVASSSEGVQVFAPGATTPSRRLPARNGVTLAVDDAGDIAVGNPTDPDVVVYPGDGAAPYRIRGSPTYDGLAYSPAGELAVFTTDRIVRTYEHGSTQPNRTFAVAALAARDVTVSHVADSAPRIAADGAPLLGRVAYDGAGNLAVENVAADTTSIIPPGAQVPSAAIPAVGGVFDAAGELVVTATQLTRVFRSRGGPPVRTIVRGGIDVAADPAASRFVLADPYRHELVVYEDDGTQTVVPNVELAMAVAISR